MKVFIQYSLLRIKKETRIFEQASQKISAVTMNDNQPISPQGRHNLTIRLNLEVHSKLGNKINPGEFDAFPRDLNDGCHEVSYRLR